MGRLVTVILAAGKGTRMKSPLPKVLHCVGGVPMVEHVLQAAQAAGSERQIAVIGFEAEQVESYLAGKAETALQAEQLGTGHAVLMTEDRLKGYEGTVLILCGDTPLLDGGELRNFVRQHQEAGADISVLTAMAPDPTGYGRILRDASGAVTGIVEHKDATEEQRKINEINTGIYCVEAPLLFELLHEVKCENVQKEYYLTDILTIARDRGARVAGIVTGDFDMVMGVNSREQLAEAERLLAERRKK